MLVTVGGEQVRLRGREEELDLAERLIREFQAENWTTEVPVALDDEVNCAAARSLPERRVCLCVLCTSVFIYQPRTYPS